MYCINGFSYNEFCHFFYSKSKLYFFNGDKSITTNAKSFSDPMHSNQQFNMEIIDSIWGINKNLKFVQIKLIK